MAFTPSSATIIRRKLQQSAAEFENGVGELFAAEAEKLNRFIVAPASTKVDLLKTTNETIKDLACCLARLECCVAEKLNMASTII